MVSQCCMSLIAWEVLELQQYKKMKVPTKVIKNFKGLNFYNKIKIQKKFQFNF